MSSHGHGGSRSGTPATPARSSRRGSRRRSSATSQPTSKPQPEPEPEPEPDTAELAPPSEQDEETEETGDLEETEQREDTKQSGLDDEDSPRSRDADDEGANDEEVTIPEVREVTAQDFDGQSFLTSLDDLSRMLDSDSVRYLDDGFPHDDLQKLVVAVTTTMENFKVYSQHSQQHMERMREGMRDVTDRIYRHIQKKAYESEPDGGRKGLEETELSAKIAQLNKDLARAAEDLTRAMHVSAETEAVALQATLAAQKAAEQASALQEEYEKRRATEQEARKAEEDRKAAEAKLQEEALRREEEERRLEEERVARLRKEEAASRPWEDWPCVTYNLDEESEFDHGVGCIVRGDPESFSEGHLVCHKVVQSDQSFVYENNDELVSNIIQISTSNGDTLLRDPVYVALPHCTTRASAMAREPVLRAEVQGVWITLPCTEVTIDAHKDLKLVQAEITWSCRLAVVTRYKRDFLSFSRKGGKVGSNVDQRLTFTAKRNAFKNPENFVVQLQPLDTTMVSEIRHREDCRGLLTASAVVEMEWTSKTFDSPVVMTLPCPPNPVKARKAAAVKAAKEAKLKNPPPPPMPYTGDDKSDDAQRRQDRRGPTKKWYMGQYALDDDDESELFYLVRPNTRGVWTVEKDLVITPVRLDVLEMKLTRPIARFLVIRVRTSVDAKEAQAIADVIIHQLALRPAHLVVRQRHDDLNDVLVQIVAASKLDRALKLIDDGEMYTEGPAHSEVIHIREGDLLEVNFRGNLGAEEGSPALEFVYNSQLTTSLVCRIKEMDRFLQRNYPMYRGMVLVNRVTKTIREVKDGEEEMDTEEVITKETLAELVVGIPKVEVTTESKAVHRVAVTIKSGGAVSEDCLRHLAEELGEEWNNLAKQLGINSIRLSAILRENQLESQPEKEAKFDMLMTWRKKVPRSMDSAQVLRHALRRCGRSDLASRLEILDPGAAQQQEAI